MNCDLRIVPCLAKFGGELRCFDNGAVGNLAPGLITNNYMGTWIIRSVKPKVIWARYTKS